MWTLISNKKNSAQQPKPENNSSVSDEILLKKIVLQDERAFKTLYARYYVKLHRFIIRMTGCQESTEEAINDVMYVVWNKANTFRTGNKVSSWIFGIAHNKALKTFARDARTNNNIDFEHESKHDKDPKDACQQVETTGWLSSALLELSPDHRVTIELSYYHGMSYNEIADIMDCNENTVKTRMFYARKKLRKILPRLASKTTSSGD